MNVKALEPYQQRVVQEKSELDVKRSALNAFIDGKTFSTLPEDERDRLTRQISYMDAYSEVLGERIAAFSK